MKTLLRFVAAPLMYLSLAVLAVMSLVWNSISLVLYPLLPPERGRAIGRAGIAYGYRAFWQGACALRVMRIEADCLDALRNEPGLIFVANHPSMLDAMLLVSRLPASGCIMKASLMRNVFLGAAARLARYIRNDSARTMVRLAVADLRAGGQLVLFPEGTRTVAPVINRFRPGVTLIAKLAQAPIQAVFIETSSPYLGKGWPIWRVPPLPITFRLRLGRRFAPRDDSAAALADIEQYFRQSLAPSAEPEPTECLTSRAPTLS